MPTFSSIIIIISFIGAKIEPGLVEDINFYRAKSGKAPPKKKLKPSPSALEKYYGVSKSIFAKNVKNLPSRKKFS